MIATKFVAPVFLLLGIMVGVTIARPSSAVPLSAFSFTSPPSPSPSSVSPAPSPSPDIITPGFLPDAPEGSQPTSPSPLSTIPTHFDTIPPVSIDEGSYPSSADDARLPSSASSSVSGSTFHEHMLFHAPEGIPVPTSPSPPSTIPTDFDTTSPPAADRIIPSFSSSHSFSSIYPSEESPTPSSTSPLFTNSSDTVTTPPLASSQQDHRTGSHTSAADPLPWSLRLAAAVCALVVAAAIILV